MSAHSGPPTVDADGVLADLAELAELTGGPGGARRVCWTAEWVAARDLLRGRLASIGVEDVEIDEAGNLWARLPGEDGSAPALALGSHLDSVPAGGPLDGALGVMAGLGVLRAWAREGHGRPPRDLVLIDFADEEGSRFGRSLFGSSAVAGTLDPAELAGLTDAAGETIAEVLDRCGVDLERAPRAHRRIGSIGSYLELHIEQGPVLDAAGESCSAVSGCAGVERFRLELEGQASHAGTTPMDHRRDAGLAAAEIALAVEGVARAHGGVGTTGSLALEPGVVTAVAGRAELAVDLRHPDSGELGAMLGDVRDAAGRIAAERDCGLAEHPIWSIEPIPFDPALVRAAEAAASRAGGRASAIASGALHDAAEMARRVPVAMVFAASVGGISHAREEDSRDDDLRAAIAAYGALAGAVLTEPPGTD
ncbi:MAG: Zn-dependent hydrolase [Solirubrobacterales bacterium]|nr:Zn-dependent hydrolase [Solirubrobacterales bacterium]